MKKPKIFDKICPKCGAINPKTEIYVGCSSSSEQCKNIIGTKKTFLGFYKDVKCNEINWVADYDVHDTWIYKKRKKSKSNDKKIT